MGITVLRPIVQKKLTAEDFNAVPEAPVDTKQYARKDGAWEEVITMRGVAVFVSATEPTEQQVNDIWIQI